MVQIDNERAQPVMERIEQLELKELEAFAKRLLAEIERHRRELWHSLPRSRQDGAGKGDA